MTENMTEEMTHLEAFGAAIGEPDPADVAVAEVESAPEEAPEQETEPEAAPEEAQAATPEEVPESDLAAKLADLSHEEVRKSVPFKGLMAETQRLREENKALKAAKPAPVVAVVPDEEPESDDDPDADVFTNKDVDARVAKLVAKALAPLRQQLEGTTKVARQASFQVGIDALKAEQAAGQIPAGVKLDAMIAKAVTELQETKPAVLADLLADPDPVRSIYQYAATRMPAVAGELAKAAKQQEQTQAERLAKGQSPGGEPPGSVDDLVDILNGRNKRT